MPIIVSFISQKGGVGKSTLARALAAVAGHFMRVRLADLDEQQATVMEWERSRKKDTTRSPCEVVAYASASKAIIEVAFPWLRGNYFRGSSRTQTRPGADSTCSCIDAACNSGCFSRILK